MRLKTGEGFSPARRFEFVFQKLVLKPELVNLRAQLMALFARIAQFKVIAEEARGSVSNVLNGTGYGSNGGNRPHANHRNVAVALHLPGEQHQLREQDYQQYGDVPVPVEK